MIIVTQGHEKGIGLEVFLKSVLSIEREDFLLVAFKKSIIATINSLKITIKFESNFIILDGYKKISFIEPVFKDNESISCLLYAMQITKSNDTLFTLPTTKDQFTINNKTYNGHTELFRGFYKRNISMFFKYRETNLLLITDHVAITNLNKLLNTNLVTEQIITTIEYLGDSIENIFIAGINPHAGEDGLISIDDDKIIGDSITNLKLNKPKLNFMGPLSADSMIHKRSNNALLVYMYHDQGLCSFKAINNFHGANISLGLPYLRVSVDFGTGFDLYGKNSADYLGCLEILKSL